MNGILKIDLWAIRLDSEEHHSVSSDEETLRAQEIANPLMRRRYERTRSMARKVLSHRQGIAPREIQLSASANGKPEMRGDARCEFSISHSGELFVMAVADIPIGVDIETRVPRQGVLALARRFFSAADFGVIQNSPAAEIEAVFLRQWVAKEAALKALGSGIGEALAEAECIYGEGGIRAVRLPRERLSLRPFVLADGTPGAVAWRGSGEADLCWRNADELKD